MFLFWRSKRNWNLPRTVSLVLPNVWWQEELRAEEVAGESFKASHFHRRTCSPWKTKTLSASVWLSMKSHVLLRKWKDINSNRTKTRNHAAERLSR